MKYEWDEVECIQDFLGKPEGNRLLGRLSSIWEYNIKIDL
jgi:hypothetical protein